jgi:cytoskeletal protein RodZ
MRPYQKKLQQKRRHLSKKHLLLGLGVIVVAAGIMTALELTNTTFLFHKNNYASAPNKPNRTLNANTKGDQGQSSPAKSNASTGSDSSHETKDNNETPSSSSQPLKQPEGTFVSNHHPNLSGSPAPNTMQSTCETTSGATCQILFTKDGITKSLPAQATDQGGAAYWTWKLQDIGLTQGTWKVQAKAVLGNQTKTADDATNLEVGP